MEINSDYEILKTAILEFTQNKKNLEKIHSIAKNVLESLDETLRPADEKELYNAAICVLKETTEKHPILQFFYKIFSKNYKTIENLTNKLAQFRENEAVNKTGALSISQQSSLEKLNSSPKVVDPALQIKFQSHFKEIDQQTATYMKIHFFLETCKESPEGLQACIERLHTDKALLNALLEGSGHPEWQNLKTALTGGPIEEKLSFLIANLFIKNKKFDKAFDTIKLTTNLDDKIFLFLKMLKSDVSSITTLKKRLPEETLETCKKLQLACKETLKEENPRAKTLERILTNTLIPGFSKIITPTELGLKIVSMMTTSPITDFPNESSLEIPFHSLDHKAPKQFEEILPYLVPSKHKAKFDTLPTWVTAQALSAARQNTHIRSSSQLKMKIEQQASGVLITFPTPQKSVCFESTIPVIQQKQECGISKIYYDTSTKKVKVELSLNKNGNWDPDCKEYTFTEKEFQQLWKDILINPWT